MDEILRQLKRNALESPKNLAKMLNLTEKEVKERIEDYEKRGIILFHDIHDRAGKVLPVLIPKLRAEGYSFAGLDAEGQLRLPK